MRLTANSVTNDVQRQPQKVSNMKKLLPKLLLLCFTFCLMLGLLEMLLRVAKPVDTYSVVRPIWAGINDDLFVVDKELGYRPIMDGQVYTETGTLKNEYSLEKPDGKQRLLFMGDSATARGKIIEALRARYGNENYEYWNAGVESYNTMQEVALYQRFNHQIKPDHVILCFHFNDFITTPMAMRGENGRLELFSPRANIRMNLWLFRNSQLYRRYLSVKLKFMGSDNIAYQEAEKVLQNFSNDLAAKKVALSVVILPVMSPYEEWRDWQLTSRKNILGICERNDLHTYDLLPALKKALAAGVDPMEIPGDFAHPSAAVSDYFAALLQEQGLLNP